MEIKKHILIINGPNLNRLGSREPGVYGAKTLDDLQNELETAASALSLDVSFKQSNSEGEIIDFIHESPNRHEGIILNAGAYTHYSYAIRDAIASVDVPVIEVHLSNVHARDDFRKESVIAPVTIGQISGFGFDSYKLALHAFRTNTDRGNGK
ncbi:type II 3-dehydroquinate dehydratase [Fictibacillus nanhaiensis]|uniref:type II 3-dehydroquinate dehydratase n=1 Tax=Fictibacillus nanhaiensis TaxID=742169 RepID=UPI001C953FFA|nr:type II 3-dehydroquinate dehydratase [Fictibacillus nanhaiensis]MBY6035538.1 type II 3-dehydroquinate dehydratase [Fictibacillus nanhaiensis]